MSIRQDLEQILTPLLPEHWTIVPYERDIDPPSTTVMMIRQHRIRYDTSIGRLLSVLALTVISARTDNLQNAEDDLDDGVNVLLDALVNVAEVRVPDGEKIRFGKLGIPAWDINVEAILERKL